MGYGIRIEAKKNAGFYYTPAKYTKETKRSKKYVVPKGATSITVEVIDQPSSFTPATFNYNLGGYSSTFTTSSTEVRYEANPSFFKTLLGNK